MRKNILIRLLASIALMLLGTCLFTQSSTAATPETQKVILHKRAYSESGSEKAFNNGYTAASEEMLKDSYGVNEAVFAVFEVGGYYQQLIKDGKSHEEAIQQLSNGEVIQRDELTKLANQEEKAGNNKAIQFITKAQTATGSYQSDAGNMKEDGLASFTLPTTVGDRPALYLIAELLPENDNSQKDGLADYLVLDFPLTNEAGENYSETLHLYTKRYLPLREPYFVKMAKESNGKTKPLAGAQFILKKEVNKETFFLKASDKQKAEWISEKDVKDPLKDERVKKLTSNKEGLVRTDVELSPGTYTFEEAATVSGYQISNESKNISVVVPEAADQSILVNDQALPQTIQVEKAPIIYNQQITGGKKFQKVDQENEQIKLNGAEFVVKNKAGDYLSKDYQWEAKQSDKTLVLVSDEEGIFEIKHLPYASYFLSEIAAPEGYYLPDNHKIEFTVNEVSGETKNILQVINKKKSRLGVEEADSPSSKQKDVGNYPKTGERNAFYLVIIGLFLLGINVFIIIKRKNIRGKSR